jgi:outer membrane protein assembly factor BamB
VLCVDATTGKTLWKSVQKEKGLSFSKQGRGICISVKGGPRLDACAAAGKVFAIGTTGRLYALDAKTGKLVWESKLPKSNAAFEAAKAALLKSGKADGARGHLTVCPLVVAGVLGVDDGGELYGLDPATGKALWGPVGGWRNAGGSCPLRWVHKGQEFIMAETTCIEPKTGEVLWKADGAVHFDESGCVALTEDYFVACGGARKGQSGLQAFKITPAGATKVWALGPEFAARQFASPVIYKGHIYTRNDAPKPNMVCIELATGKVVGRADAPGSCNEIVGAAGRVFYEGSYQGPIMYKAEPKDFRLLSGGALKTLDFACSVPPAIDGGRMYYRSNANGIMCLDLRKGSTAGKPVKEFLSQ